MTLTRIIFVFFVSCLATSHSLANSPALVVNIDSPNFRKILMATPAFKLEALSKNADGQQLSKTGSEYLGKILSFSGLFNSMDSAAFTDIMSKAKDEWYSDNAVKGVDLSVWKSISTDAVTFGYLQLNANVWTLTLKTVDLSRNEVMVAKRYSNVDSTNLIKIMRRYGDAVLKAYTGKNGIFNSKIVFSGRATKGGAKVIYVSDFDGSNAFPITRGNGPFLSPSWSRDGKQVVYTSFEDGNPDLFVFDFATQKSRKVSGYKGINSGGNFAPNGNLIAFTGSINGDAEIFLTTPKGASRKLFISGSGLDVDPTFSPDGKMIAFVSGRFGNPHLFVANLQWNGDNQIRVLGDKRVTFAGWYNATPAWTPEGDRLAFAGYDKEIDRFDLFLVNPDGTKLDRMTLRTGDNERPSFSPNGQNIVFMSNRTNGQNVKSVHQLHVMNRDGSSQRQINTGLYEAQTPSWGPNLEE